jgi:thiol-disulfide isomerase/thioredoxin
MFVLLCALPVLLRAQAPAKITLAELEARAAAAPDTLFVYNLWATWCKPCVLEMPYFDQVSQDSAGRPFQVVFISLDLPSEYDTRLPQFLKKRKFHAQVLWLDEPKIQSKIDSVSPAWTGAIPATLFVCSGRALREFHEGDFSLESLREKLNTLNP